VTIDKVEPLEGFCVRLTFTDGSVKDVDLSPYLNGPVFKPLRENLELFRRVQIDEELGTIVWENGADICPDVLYYGRTPEAMTLFAVACAGMFPLLHLGRPWLFYWLLPYPNTMGLWPQFRSPLVWDVFAVSTYATVSLLFWYVGLIPDLATLRERTFNRFARAIYGMLAMGWRGSAMHWHRYETAYSLLAGLATPLVVSVHSVVSFDFAVGIVPGWHSTIFPPLFRRRCDLFRFRDGHDPRHPTPRCLWVGRLHHDATPQEHGENSPGDELDCHLRIYDGNVHGMVQRESVRILHDFEPNARALCPLLLGAHPV